MMNKKGFSTKDFLISTLLFSSIILLFTLAIADMQGSYPDNPNIINEDFAETYTRATEELSTIDTMRDTALSGEGLSFRGTFDVTFGSFFTVIKLIFSSLNAWGEIFVFLPITFGFIDSAVLSIFMTLGLSILTVVLIFKLINAVGRNPV